MDGLSDNKYSIAWFIRQSLENVFAAIGMERIWHEAKDQQANFTFENGKLSTDAPGKKLPLTVQQSAVLSQGLLNLALKLPAFLYNAGYTGSIISSNSIHIKLHNQFLGVDINSVGLFILDIRGNKFHARTWQEAAVNEGAPIPLNEVAVKHATHKRNLNVEAEVSESINRDIDFLKGKLEGYLNKQGIPTKLEQLIPEMKVNWLKHKNLVKKTAGFREVYKGLYKGNNALTAIHDIGTAKQGTGNLPGIGVIPGGDQVMAMENDEYEKMDFDFIDLAQRTPATNKRGGYQALIKMMSAYNRHNWRKEKFVGAYVHEGQLDMIESMECLLTEVMGFSTNFTEKPYDDKEQKPYEYFIYVRSDKLSYSLISIKDVGVIYVNPAVE